MTCVIIQEQVSATPTRSEKELVSEYRWLKAARSAIHGRFLSGPRRHGRGTHRLRLRSVRLRILILMILLTCKNLHVHAKLRQTPFAKSSAWWASERVKSTQRSKFNKALSVNGPV